MTTIRKAVSGVAADQEGDSGAKRGKSFRPGAAAATSTDAWSAASLGSLGSEIPAPGPGPAGPVPAAGSTFKAFPSAGGGYRRYPSSHQPPSAIDGGQAEEVPLTATPAHPTSSHPATSSRLDFGKASSIVGSGEKTVLGRHGEAASAVPVLHRSTHAHPPVPVVVSLVGVSQEAALARVDVALSEASKALNHLELACVNKLRQYFDTLRQQAQDEAVAAREDLKETYALEEALDAGPRASARALRERSSAFMATPPMQGTSDRMA